MSLYHPEHLFLLFFSCFFSFAKRRFGKGGAFLFPELTLLSNRFMLLFAFFL